MNQYLYPWHDLYGNNQIEVILAKSYNECKEKIVEKYLNMYDLDDTLEFDDFLDQLCDKYGVYVGDIYDINEF